ncbi:MAG: glycosyltransferase family 1 protein [Patescibacteria group bacterium]
MKIAIDVSQVVYGTGVSVYTENLVKSLHAIDNENEYLLFGGTLRKGKELRDKFPNVKVFPISPAIANLIWNRLHVFSVENLVGKIDVFHSSDWTQPPSRAFNVTTIHDLSPIIFSRYTDPKIVAAHEMRLNWVKKEVDRIIVPSQSTKEDLLKLGFNQNIISVIYEAPAPVFKKATVSEIERVRQQYKIFSPFIMSIGVSLRKNTKTLVSAFEKAKKANLKLILVGGTEATKIEDSRGVIVVGEVPNKDLVALYSGAEAFVYPSLYEGFGLPILEAFACGCPVVTSNVSSMPEVAGKAAVLVDPTDELSIAEGINLALRRKTSLSRAGLARVKKFSWQKTAVETLKVYNSFHR